MDTQILIAIRLQYLTETQAQTALALLIELKKMLSVLQIRLTTVGSGQWAVGSGQWAVRSEK